MHYRLQDCKIQSFNKESVDIRNFDQNSDGDGSETVYQDLKIKGIKPCLFDSESRMLSEHFKPNNFRTFFHHVEDQARVFLNNNNLPTLIIETEGTFTHLDRVFYSNETIKHLNKKGLHIYFRELPYFKTQKEFKKVDPGNFVVHEDYDWNVWKKSLFGYNGNKIVGVYEFDSLKKFIKNNKLTNVFVYTGCYKLKEFVQHKYPQMKIHTYDFVLMSVSIPRDYVSLASYNPKDTIPSSNTIQKKFVSMNKKYDALREIVTNYLYDKSSLLSYYHRNVDFMIYKDNETIDGSEWDWYWEDINRRLWMPFEQLSVKPKLRNLTQLSIDKVGVKSNSKDQDWDNFNDHTAYFDKFPVKEIQSCFCQVVCESWFAFPTGHFADKLFVPVKTFRPFVLFSTPFTLEYFRKCGFKTFEKWWDESYDLETDHNKRMKKVFDTIDYIDRLSIDECKKIYNEMKPVLEHNHKQLKIFSTAEYKKVD